jgi:hypothetical protein
VDGVLDEETAARLEAESRNDAALKARIARQRELRARLRAELDPVLEEPIPQRLLDTLAAPDAGAAVTPIGAARQAAVRAARPPWSLREWGAIAATLVVGILVGQLAFRGSSDLPIESENGGLVAAAYLDTALSTQLTGAAPAGASARIGLSFRAADGEYCRTFALDRGAGLACRRDGRWSVELLDNAGAARDSPDSFRQASSALSPAMLGAIAALGAGEALTVEEERQRVASGWEGEGGR